MKYSYSWLKELSGTRKPVEKVVEDLTFHSFEVEGLEKRGVNIEGVVVGKIIDIKKHPNADKLQLVKIDAGMKSDLDIVCGAWNIKTGDKVPVAQVGTKLPNSMEIKEAQIRGEKSFGMLCSEDELGIGKDHSGIFIFPENAKIGDPISKYFGSKDSVIEIKVLPDRAHDGMSYVGVAREIALLERRKFDYDFDGLKLPKKKSKKLKISIKDNKLCPRYIGAVIENIKIKESPEWMKKRLEASGIRAINNVVDATNYVMLELGNPLHAFDADKLIAQRAELNIVVRKAKKGEAIELLDGAKKELTPEDLLITDGDSPLVVAGIKGGRLAEIDNDTKNIVLEAANFNAVNIRKTRTQLNIKTDSSDRFEKDIDPNLAEKAMVRIIEIIEHIAGGKLEGIVDIYPKKVEPWKIRLDSSYANSLLGEFILVKDMMSILNLLGIKTKKGKVIECIIPTFRIDIKTQEDLIEEIGRIWGYEKIKEQPIVSEILPAQINEQAVFERKIQDILIGLGFSEVYNYSFYSQEDIDVCGLEKIKHLELANPMNPDQQFVRAGLFPNIFKNIRENSKYFNDFMIFEMGKCYHSDGKNEVKERKMLSLAIVSENEKNDELFFRAKGNVEDIFEYLGVEKITFEKSERSVRLWNFNKCAMIKSGNEVVGKLGKASQEVLDSYKIKSSAAMVEIDIENLFNRSSKIKIYKPINKFPTIIRDISMLSEKIISVSEIIDLIKKTGGNLLLNVELFDIFQKDNKNSFAFHIEFSSESRTLESKEVDEVVSKIVDTLENSLKINIRK